MRRFELYESFLSGASPEFLGHASKVIVRQIMQIVRKHNLDDRGEQLPCK